ACLWGGAARKGATMSLQQRLAGRRSRLSFFSLFGSFGPLVLWVKQQPLHLTSDRRLSLRAPAAVDVVGGAGDEGGGVGGEPGDEGRHFVRGAVALDCEWRAVGGSVGAVGGVALRVGRSGLYEVDGNAARAEVSREPPGEAAERGLARSVEADAGAGAARAQGAADGDDAAAVRHRRGGALGGE